MDITVVKISVSGRQINVPCLQVDGGQVVVSGRALRIARVQGESWLPSARRPDPVNLLDRVKGSGLKADIFTFAQPPSEPKPRHPYPFEWENAAVIPISTFQAWWDALPQVARRNVRTAAKKGVEVRPVPFDDDLVNGIKSIYDETPVRLEKAFWHYGKDLATIKRENSSYLDRSEFIGAFHESRLIGFIKLVYVDSIGSIMQILAMVRHQDKRTTYALIAKAIEVCEQKGMKYLQYCSLVYGKNDSSPLADFKRRNGFERVDYPRYYVGLTFKGRAALALRLHRGIKSFLPKPLFSLGLRVRAGYCKLGLSRHRGLVACPSPRD